MSQEHNVLPRLQQPNLSAFDTAQQVDRDVSPTGWPGSPVAWNWPQPLPAIQ